MPLLARFAENGHAQPADGGGHAVAIEIKRGAVWCDDRPLGIHLHAIDHCQEVGALQAKFRDSRAECSGDEGGGIAGIQPVDLATPLGQTGPPLVEVRLVVGNVVDGAAKGVDGEDRFPTPRRQQSHGPVERGAGRQNLAGDLTPAGEIPAQRGKLAWSKPSGKDQPRTLKSSTLAPIWFRAMNTSLTM